MVYFYIGEIWLVWLDICWLFKGVCWLESQKKAEKISKCFSLILHDHPTDPTSWDNHSKPSWTRIFNIISDPKLFASVMGSPCKSTLKFWDQFDKFWIHLHRVVILLSNALFNKKIKISGFRSKNLQRRTHPTYPSGTMSLTPSAAGVRLPPLQVNSRAQK